MIPSLAANEIINRLEAASFDAFAVGGAVRDILIGRVPNDFDVATSAKTDEIKRILSDKVVIPTGEKHGTVTVICGDEHIEVTTFRIDGQYSDARHPSGVTFVGSIFEDLSRRDFTINAIAYNDRLGIVDPFDGVGDIKRRVVRAVGVPQKRFSEDALRILRCIRFASVLGFGIDEDTDEALRECFPLLESISAERIFIELKLFLMGDFRWILESHQYIFKFLFPNWVLPATPFPKDGGDISTRLAYFFSEIDLDSANAYLHSLRSDNATKKEVLSVLAALKYQVIISRRDALYFLSEYGYDTVMRALVLRGHEGESDIVKSVLGCCYTLDELQINGNDLIKLGYSGIEIRKVKKRLLHAVIDGVVSNEKEALLKFLAQ